MSSIKRGLKELREIITEAKAKTKVLAVKKTSNPLKLQAGRNRLEQLANTIIFLHDQRLGRQTETDARLKTACLMAVMFNLMRIEFLRIRNNTYLPIGDQMKYFPQEQFNRIRANIWPKLSALNSWLKQLDKSQRRGNPQEIINREDFPGF